MSEHNIAPLTAFVDDNSKRWIVQNHAGWVVADCGLGTSTIAKQNAELIVKTVNAYGPLVETVKSISQFTTDEVVKRIALQTLKDIGEDTE